MHARFVATKKSVEMSVSEKLSARTHLEKDQHVLGKLSGSSAKRMPKNLLQRSWRALGTSGRPLGEFLGILDGPE